MTRDEIFSCWKLRVEFEEAILVWQDVSINCTLFAFSAVTLEHHLLFFDPRAAF